MPEYMVRDGLRNKTITGTQISEYSTQRREKSRWIELELYYGTEKDVPGEAYFVHIVGQSVVYHWPGSECNKGVPVAWLALPDDAEPCRDCRPPALPPLDMDGEPLYRRPVDGPAVYLESVRHTFHRCDDGDDRYSAARQVIRKLSMHDGKLSSPAETLLERAVAADQWLAEALQAYIEGRE